MLDPTKSVPPSGIATRHIARDPALERFVPTVDRRIDGRARAASASRHARSQALSPAGSDLGISGTKPAGSARRVQAALR